jgi:hypothetical protein
MASLPLAPELQDMPIMEMTRRYQTNDRQGKSLEIAANLGLKTIILSAFPKLTSQWGLGCSSAIYLTRNDTPGIKARKPGKSCVCKLAGYEYVAKC